MRYGPLATRHAARSDHMPTENEISGAAQPSMLARAEQIQRELNHLSGRDLQLWSIGALIIVVLTAGLLCLVFPNLIWKQHAVHVEQSYMPQLFFGLTCLIVLFNIYILGQKRSLNATRRALVRELVLNERLESLSLIDPLTQLLNRRAMDEVIAREVARANRIGDWTELHGTRPRGVSGHQFTVWDPGRRPDPD